MGVPSFRPDLEREIDLVEEVLRVFGMERVESTLPGGRERVGELTAAQQDRERMGATLRAAGLNETMTYAFTDPGDLERIGMELDGDELLVELINPMSAEQAVLRRTLLPGLLRSASYNQRRGVDNVHLYEMGSVYWTAERSQAAEGAAGRSGRARRLLATRAVERAGRTARLLRRQGRARGARARARPARASRCAPQSLPWLQPGRAAEVLAGGEVVGWLGEVHPAVLARFECDGTGGRVRDRCAPLHQAPARAPPSLSSRRRHPAVELDLAIVVDEDVTAERVEQAIRSAGGKLLEDARLFDVYRGTGVCEAGKKSMAFALTYRAADRTLTAEEVEAAHERLVAGRSGATGG